MAELMPDVDGDWAIELFVCTNPDCQRLVVELLNGEATRVAGLGLGFRGMEPTARRLLVYPAGVARRLLGAEVPADFVRERDTAAAVLSDSAEASAALTRRSLQRLLIDQGGTTKRDLDDQIEEVLGSGQLPPYLADQIDAVRVVGNFAAHATKSQHTGEIIGVEPGEAEQNLNTLEDLLDFYFVQSAECIRRREDINTKLREAGKPELK